MSWLTWSSEMSHVPDRSGKPALEVDDVADDELAFVGTGHLHQRPGVSHVYHSAVGAAYVPEPDSHARIRERAAPAAGVERPHLSRVRVDRETHLVGVQDAQPGEHPVSDGGLPATVADEEIVG